MKPPSLPRSRDREIPPEVRQEVLHLAEHYGTRQIALRVGRSRKIVRKILTEAGQKAHPTPPTRSAGGGKLTPFHERIREGVEKKWRVTRILREIREIGYDGGRTILADHVRQLKTMGPMAVRKQAKRRFETPPGVECQVDWSPVTVLIAGKPVGVHVLGILMASSRKVFYGIYRNERQSTLLEGLAAGFEYFHGCPLRVVFDNMATVVLGRIGQEGAPLWNQRFQEFARHYGFESFLCAVNDPDRKGKKERSFQLIQDDFLRGSTFDSWDDMQARLGQWLDQTPGVANLRRHGTTGLVPNDAFKAEQDLLIALPSQRFSVFDETIRIVESDCTLSINGIRYSVPAVLACRSVPVRLFTDHFEVFDARGRLLSAQPYLDRTTQPGRLVIDPSHYANLPRRPRNREDGRRLDQAFLRRFPTLGPLVDGLKTAMKTIVGIHLRALLRLAETYGQEAFLAAATKAQEYRRFDANVVRRILEQEHPLQPEDTSPILEGLGPTLLGEVEETTLDEFAHLDRKPTTDPEDDHGPK
jgi:transposase